MNITTDNYEAYLIDYLDGNLSADETEHLKQFVAAQGLNWDELTENLPHLEAPQIVYQNKSELRSLSPYKSRSLSLSKGRPNRTIIPLYVKIASAAAAAGLLLTVSLWPEKSLPKVEPIAELKPIHSSLTITEDPLRIVPKRSISFNESQETTTKTKKETKNEFIRTKVEAIAVLSSVQAQEIANYENEGFALASDIELLRYQLETEQVLARLALEPTFEEEMPTSLIGKGIYRMTEGRHASIGDLINAGLHIAKKEIKKASTDAALATYYRAEGHIEEAKEHWQEKREE
jgi:hypothetical protein